MEEMIRFENVNKIYGEQKNAVYALKDASFTIEKGEFVVILGPSGAGKSTLLNLLGGMDRFNSGHIFSKGQDITAYNEKQLAQYRATSIGFVFQFYNLIPTLTVYENVALMKELKKDILKPDEAIAMVGLSEHMHKYPSQLSGGEQQRVSIARALVKKPDLLLCDEPTGALDSETGLIVLKQLHKMCKEQGYTTIIVTHNAMLAKAADRVIHVRNGKIDHVEIQTRPCLLEEVDW